MPYVYIVQLKNFLVMMTIHLIESLKIPKLNQKTVTLQSCKCNEINIRQ